MKTNMSCYEIQKYELELSEFLIQRINDAGGSLQFQHLSGVLHQLESEVKDAFGITKSNLMRYLRAHSRLFKIDPKGIVRVSGTLKRNECDSNDMDEVLNEGAKKIVPSDIKNGRGVIFKIFSDFAIIEVRKPFKTYVFFTPQEFGGTKDELFLDYDLTVKSKVCFNAIYGHNDYEIKYRATKVWETSDSDDESSNHRKNEKDKNVKILTGTGVIQKCCPQFGFISVSGHKNKTVVFYRKSVKDCGISLAKFFTSGDEVEFVAEKVPTKDGVTQWQAIEVEKLKKKKNQPPSAEIKPRPTEESAKILENKSPNRKKNELGKIFPCQTGAVIKFGKNFSELADGKSADYYLYGCKVCDIAFEFSVGDDVQFDAIKSKDHYGWKAVLVWVGEKPPESKTIREKKDCDENLKNFGHTSTKNVLTKPTHSSSKLRPEATKSKFHNVEYKKENDRKQNEKSIDVHSFRKKSDRSLNKYGKDISKTSKTTVKRNSSKKFERCFNDDDVYLEENTENKSIPKFSRNDFENFNTSPVSDDTFSDENISESSSSSSDEGSHNFINSKKYLKSDFNYSDEKLTSSTNEISDSTEVASNNPVKPSIKKFENLEGIICRVHCKLAWIKSSHIQENIDFVLNAFYLNGKPVEELQVEDLKEVVNSGDVVSFNYFEIIDDFGETYRKVTSAWKGLKPEVHEKSPEEFIAENDISVSIDSKSQIKDTPEKNCAIVERTSSSESLEYYSDTESYFETMNTDIQPEYSTIVETHKSNESKKDDLLVFNDTLSDSASNDFSMVDDLSVINDRLSYVESNDYSRVDDLSVIDDESKNLASSVYSRDNDLSSDVQIQSKDDLSDDAQCTLTDNLSSPEENHRLLFKKIVEKLKLYSDISINSEVESAIYNIINLVLKDYVYKLHDEAVNQGTSLSQPSTVSCSCTKRNQQTSSGQGNKVTTIPAEIQTIVTGEVIAASIYTQN